MNKELLKAIVLFALVLGHFPALFLGLYAFASFMQLLTSPTP